MSGDGKNTVRVTDMPKAVLVRPVAFHVALARLCQSALAGLMLSQAIYWTRTKLEAGGWFYKTREEWAAEIYLSRWEQQSARAILRTFDFWQEQRRGVPAQMYFRVDLGRLTRAIAQMVGKHPSSLQDANKLDVEPPTSRTHCHQQGGDETANISTETTTRDYGRR